MTRKPVSELTPDELAQRREYMREAKRRSRLGKLPEKDTRTYSDRADYLRVKMRDVMAKRRTSVSKI